MRITHLLDKVAKIRRLTATSGYKRELGTIGSAQVCVQRRWSDAELVGDNERIPFRLYADTDANILSGDNLRIVDDERIFRVVAVESKDYGISSNHKEIKAYLEGDV